MKRDESGVSEMLWGRRIAVGLRADGEGRYEYSATSQEEKADAYGCQRQVGVRRAALSRRV